MCDMLSRDTVQQFLVSGQGYLSGMDPCSCDATALFLSYYFSSTAFMSSMSHQPITNATFNMWQLHTGVLTYDHAAWRPHMGCDVPSPSAHRATFEELRSLFTAPSKRPQANLTDPGKIVQIYLQSPALGTGHTFVIQQAQPGEFYIWMGFIGEYDLWTWIQQDPFAGRNFTGGKSKYAGVLDFATLSTFISKLESLTAGSVPWNQVAPLWQELFWVEPPIPKSLPFCSPSSPDQPIPTAVAYWRQMYTDDNCDASALSFRVSWDDEHEQVRQKMCDSSTPVQPCSGIGGAHSAHSFLGD